jgi:abl interactor 2
MYTPPALAGKKASSEFAPPPVRRVPVTTSAPEPEEEAQPEPEEESDGVWAEALYDYTSEVRLLVLSYNG